MGLLAHMDFHAHRNLQSLKVILPSRQEGFVCLTYRTKMVHPSTPLTKLMGALSPFIASFIVPRYTQDKLVSYLDPIDITGPDSKVP